MSKKPIIKPLTNYSDPVTSEIQENLNRDLLKEFIPSRINPIISSRPTANFIDLMNWTLDSFKDALKDQYNINKFVQNRIIIDGQFVQFCRENSIKIDCLYKDSIISWKTEHEYEKFFVQGVFLIKGQNFEFIHAALFHKGNQNEDEISFFVLVPESSYEEYIKLRNKFDNWIQQRDRGNLQIHVIDGDDIPYTKEHTWEDLFLPKDIKTEISGLVENFLSSKDFYQQNKIPWKRGILLYGTPGCHAAGTPILMYDGSWKKVEDIVVGDNLMGPDSQSREVLKLVRGNEDMYEVCPVKGKSFFVNKNHILHLAYYSRNNKFLTFTNMTIDQYLQLSRYVQEKLKLVKSPCLSFENVSDDLELDPYLLGVWIGDGTTGKQEIKSDNNDINSFSKALKASGISDKKCIPEKYFTSSVHNRLALLAGIIDNSSKDSQKQYKGVLYFVQKDYCLVKQIEKLALSLGFGITIKPYIQSINFNDTYYKLCIYGDVQKIPVLLQEKPQNILSNKNCRHIGIKSINLIGKDNYYGFVLDKDHLYIMDDYYISHNCGKTSIIRTIISVYNFKPVTIVPETNNDGVREAFAYAEEQSPSLLYFEDLDSLLEKVDASSFLNLMDGISAKNGLLVMATANDVKKLKKNITDRPSRFDRKFEIPLPTQEMAYIYLNRWFGKLISVAKSKELAKYAVENDFSYAYLKELYISAMFEALSHNRKAPISSDIDRAISSLVKDKNLLNNENSISTDKYFNKK